MSAMGRKQTLTPTLRSVEMWGNRGSADRERGEGSALPDSWMGAKGAHRTLRGVMRATCLSAIPPRLGIRVSLYALTI